MYWLCVIIANLGLVGKRVGIYCVFLGMVCRCGSQKGEWFQEGCIFRKGTLGEEIGTPWLRPFQKVKKL